MYPDLQNPDAVAVPRGSARLKQWVSLLAINTLVYFIGIPLLAGDGWSVYDPSKGGMWFWLIATVLVTALSVALSDRSARRAQRDPVAMLARIERDLENYEGPGWLKRTVRVGVLMGFGVAIPIGLLMALLIPDEYGVGWERWSGIAFFCVATFAWTIPMSFLIRWMSLHSLRKYIRTVGSPSLR